MCREIADEVASRDYECYRPMGMAKAISRIKTKYSMQPVTWAYRVNHTQEVWVRLLFVRQSAVRRTLKDVLEAGRPRARQAVTEAWERSP